MFVAVVIHPVIEFQIEVAEKMNELGVTVRRIAPM